MRPEINCPTDDSCREVAERADRVYIGLNAALKDHFAESGNYDHCDDEISTPASNEDCFTIQLNRMSLPSSITDDELLEHASGWVSKLKANKVFKRYFHISDPYMVHRRWRNHSVEVHFDPITQYIKVKANDLPKA